MWVEWMVEARLDSNRLVENREIDCDEAEVLAPQMGLAPSQLTRMRMNVAVRTNMSMENLVSVLGLFQKHSKEEVIRILEKQHDESSSPNAQPDNSQSASANHAAAEEHRLLGNEAFKRKDYEPAVKHCTDSIEQAADHPAFPNRAARGIEVGRCLDALKDVQRRPSSCARRRMRLAPKTQTVLRDARFSARPLGSAGRLATGQLGAVSGGHLPQSH